MEKQAINQSSDNAKKQVVEKAIPTTSILKMDELKKYSKDYLRVLLPKKEYKPSEAIKIIKTYFKEL